MQAQSVSHLQTPPKVMLKPHEVTLVVCQRGFLFQVSGLMFLARLCYFAWRVFSKTENSHFARNEK